MRYIRNKITIHRENVSLKDNASIAYGRVYVKGLIKNILSHSKFFENFRLFYCYFLDIKIAVNIAILEFLGFILNY